MSNQRGNGRHPGGNGRHPGGNGKQMVSWDGPYPGPVYAEPPAAGFGGGMEAELRTYLGILRRRMAWIVGVFLGVVGAALLFTVLQHPVYRASALLEVNAEAGDTPSLDGALADRSPTDEDLRTHFGLLRSAALAQRVVEDLRLDTLPEFASDADTPMQSVVGEFLDRLVVDPIEESRLVTVSFDAGSPDLSADIVNTTIDDYTAMRRDARSGAASRLSLQLDSAKAHLEASERKLSDYAASKNLPYLVDEDPAAELGTRISDLRDRLAEARDARYEKESLYNAVVGQGHTEILDNEVIRQLKLRLADLRKDYAQLSATFTDDYPATAEVRRQIDDVSGLLEEEQADAAKRIESDYRLAQEREQKLTDAIDEQEKTARELGLESGTYHILRQAVLANRTLYTTLQTRQREAEVAISMGPTDLSVIDAALPPTGPHRPVFAMNMALAMMLGLVLGVGAAFVREILDNTVQTLEGAPARADLPVLAMIPSLEAAKTEPFLNHSARRVRGLLSQPRPNGGRAEDRRDGSWPRIDTIDRRDPSGIAIADAFGSLRTAVLSREDQPLPRLVLVSSCRAGEGKTTVSLNLAMSLTHLVSRVLLIDGDLRKPAVHRALGIGRDPGLADCLRGEVSLGEAVQPSGARGLDVLTSGRPTTSAGDLLAGSRLGAIMQEAEARYDFVIVDAPALFINASDATVLAHHMDGVVVVVRSRSTPKALVQRIPFAVPNLIGVVVNDLRRSSLPDYFGEYFAGYAEVGQELGAGATSSEDP